MITISNVYVQYGDRILLNRVNLVIQEKEKVGLVGRNGAGKSTLLKIIAGEQGPQDGDVSRPSDSTLGFLHQEMELPMGRTVLEEALTAFEETRRMEERIAEITTEIGERTDYESEAYQDLLIELSSLNERFQLLGGATMEADAERVLQGLGFRHEDMHRQTDEFSGGWKMRVELAKMLLRRPDFLLLDEPTNHLDIESIIWLEQFLRTYQGCVVIISHDKTFLDNTTSRTVEVELGNLYDYKASYTKYVELRKERREKLQQAYENQQRLIAEKEKTINRFMAKATKTKQAQSMQKQLDKLERIELDEADTAVMNLRFPPAPRSGQTVVDAQKVTKKYDEKLVLNQVDLQLDRGDRIAFVGQNGQGKTTLAKMIVDELSITGGELKLGHNVQIGYYAQNQSDTLQPGLTVLETMEQISPPDLRPKLRTILGAFMFSGEDVEKKVSVLSGGERARLALACLLLHPFNLLVLDEPTNHLDIQSKDVLKRALQHYDGTMVVVSHDREFLSELTNRTLEFRDHNLHHYIGDVNAFLEKRQLDNMRDVELKQKKPSVGHATSSENGMQQLDATPRPDISHEMRKQLRKAVSKAEKKVEKLEERLAKMETEMADPDFYNRDDAEQRMQQHGQLKKDLELAMEEWEQAQEKWEIYE